MVKMVKCLVCMYFTTIEKNIQSLNDLGRTSKDPTQLQLECSKGYSPHSGQIFYQEGGGGGKLVHLFCESLVFTRSVFKVT